MGRKKDNKIPLTCALVVVLTLDARLRKETKTASVPKNSSSCPPYLFVVIERQLTPTRLT
jgi:hypothetical protein